MNVVIDTDALIAITDPKDSLHLQAKAILLALLEHNAELLLLPTTLCEFGLVATYHLGIAKTKAVIEVWTKGYSHLMLPIDEALSLKALERYASQTSKQESLFDCYVMEAAEKHHADCIFSFDQGYKKQKNKYTLAFELFKD